MRVQPPTATAKIRQEFEADVPLDRLKLHPDNPNQGDLGALMESMAVNGFGGALWVQRSTSYVLDGNHRLIAAREFGLTVADVLWMDVDDETATRLLIASDRIARLGLHDQAILFDQLSGLAQTDVGLAGTGYDGDDLDRLLRDLAMDGDLPSDRPERAQSFNVTVRCRDAAEQTEALQRLLALGFEARAR